MKIVNVPNMDIKVNFVKDIVQKNLITLEYVRSENNVVDIFTKALMSCKHVNLRNKLGIM